MRAWFAILFSLLVATAQPALMANDLAKPAEPACCGTCAAPCCQAKAPAESAPIPAAPTRSVSQDDWQFVFALLTHFSVRATDAPQNVFSRLASVPSPRLVPIFQRDCSYLI